MAKSKVVIIPARPDPSGRDRIRTDDPRYMEGQRLLVEAMKYLLQSDRDGNREAAELLSEHVRTRFRMSDSPLAARVAIDARRVFKAGARCSGLAASRTRSLSDRLWFWVAALPPGQKYGGEHENEWESTPSYNDLPTGRSWPETTSARSDR